MKQNRVVDVVWSRYNKGNPKEEMNGSVRF